ncbi:hypothetical protein E7T06_03620 [Deinococcus sp. Arct2-2]|uniref:hypothetical protein n=1 Tax=Deinococcus sp. Arct2-2 TaxID=2568653 RepID=UPI0010A4180B|nr:hypothetical protein [Deinococcus sp. Arct2-2]THF71176.1 hypothetical protein E7T06_03620 [Deinococcus sp. Arct2-2]
MKPLSILLALTALTSCHRLAPAPFSGVGTEVMLAQNVLAACGDVTWTMRVIGAKTKADLGESLSYRILLNDVILESEHAFAPVRLTTTGRYFQFVLPTPAADTLMSSEFKCTGTGEVVKTALEASPLGGLQLSVTYAGGLRVQ